MIAPNGYSMLWFSMINRAKESPGKTEDCVSNRVVLIPFRVLKVLGYWVKGKCAVQDVEGRILGPWLQLRGRTLAKNT